MTEHDLDALRKPFDNQLERLKHVVSRIANATDFDPGDAVRMVELERKKTGCPIKTTKMADELIVAMADDALEREKRKGCA